MNVNSLKEQQETDTKMMVVESHFWERYVSNNLKFIGAQVHF